MVKALVIYDSLYGNTEKIAKALVVGLMSGGVDASAIKVDAVKFDGLGSVDLLCVGSPVQAWNMSKPMKEFLESLKSIGGLSGKKAFAFDTKMSRSRFAGSAAGKIEGKLKSIGLIIIRSGESAYVKGEKGPLEEMAEESFRLIGVELAKML